MMGDKDPVIMSVMGNVYKAGIDTGGDPKRPWRGKAMWVYLHNPDSRVYISPDNLILVWGKRDMRASAGRCG